MGSGSTRVGSSISSLCSGHRRRTQSRSRRSGVPEWSGCGCRPVFRWFGTDSNPNKLFFGCPNYNVSYQQVERDGVGFLCGQILDKMNQLRNQNLMKIIMK
ncbi:hypothetical protein Ahy_A05g025046 [Arachis hypogaea]|uniref:Uncharacterized protein n=1 Tax=Arachis hypogaea TaxID=3818 RepID=A0A445D7G7_ARAHY|nr:hypothetical protein Ahy_A05g025046 [Arachis hypogaea]